jgi:hypothetical protein
MSVDADSELAFIGCESTDEVAVIDLERQNVLDLIKAGTVKAEI